MGMVLRIAAHNSSVADKQTADIVCTGKHDQRIINQQIAKLTRGGTIQLLDGDYYLDAFENEGNSAIYFGYNEGNARTVKIIGDTDNKSYNTHFGVSLHVTKAALDSLPEGETGRVFFGTSTKPKAPGAFFTYTFVNNAYFENFFLFLHDASRPVIGVDCSQFGVAGMYYVGIYTENHFNERYLHIKASTPTKGCIGVRSFQKSSDGMARVGFTHVEVSGLHTGFHFIGGDHAVLQNCHACRCCYGYMFESSIKTLTMINCSDEGNTHLPVFHGHGQLTAVDFCIERLNLDHMPDDPEGNTEPYAVEDTPGNWRGFLSYTMEGRAFPQNHFWKKGHGINFHTVNLRHNLNERPEDPEYLQTYFDRNTKKMLLWTGEIWVDAMGNPAE